MKKPAKFVWTFTENDISSFVVSVKVQKGSELPPGRVIGLYFDISTLAVAGDKLRRDAAVSRTHDSAVVSMKRMKEASCDRAKQREVTSCRFAEMLIN
jgi:hypothetical protein